MVFSFSQLQLQQTPPNTQIAFLILRTLKSILQHFSPNSLSEKSEADLVMHLAQIIGQSYIKYFEPDSLQSLVDDCIELFQLMLKTPEWKGYLIRRISQSYQISQNLIKQQIPLQKWTEDETNAFK